MASEYKTLFQGAVPAGGAATIATVPGGKQWIIGHIVVVNITGGDLTFQLFKNGTSAEFSWTNLRTVKANDFDYWDGTETMGDAETWAADASAGASLYITISGDEVTP